MLIGKFLNIHSFPEVPFAEAVLNSFDKIHINSPFIGNGCTEFPHSHGFHLWSTQAPRPVLLRYSRPSFSGKADFSFVQQFQPVRFFSSIHDTNPPGIHHDHDRYKGVPIRLAKSKHPEAGTIFHGAMVEDPCKRFHLFRAGSVEQAVIDNEDILALFIRQGFHEAVNNVG